MEKTISVVGLGKLGAPLAACLATKGMRVIGIDKDPRKVNAINGGHAPLYEPQLEEFIRKADSRLTATGDISEAVRATEITFVVVATPSEPNGGFSLRFVLPVCKEIGQALRGKPGFHLVVLTSTVMPGMTGGPVRAALEEASGKVAGRDFGLCYGPEFIALGSVIRDFLNPDFVLIGESDPRSGAILESLYQQVCENRPQFSRMNFVNAELTKLSVNTFVTTKISFANMLARICERLAGADVDAVTTALGLDSRIGAKYLKGAISYGGPCFPRDNHALAAMAREIGAPADLAEVTDRFNRMQVNWLADLAQSYATSSSSVGVLGLTYKPHTDVVEEAPGFLLAKELARRGVSLVLYDPASDPCWLKALDGEFRVAETPEQCVKQSDVVVLTTPWRECCLVPMEHWARHPSPRTVIDCWRVLPHLEHKDGVTYLALGTGKLRTASIAAAETTTLPRRKHSTLTLFALPKAFKGHFGLIQRNAISQWVRLRPRPEIILFGNEEGTAEIAQEFGLRHVPEVRRNQYGTPLLSDLFEKAHAYASNSILCYANADIVLLGNFMKAIGQVSARHDRFLIVGRRTNLDLDEPAVYGSPDQEDRLRTLASTRGQLAPPHTVDYFVFSRGIFNTIPEFAIGRFSWDNWLIWRARTIKAAVVDASAVILAVHQNHDYSHHPKGLQGVRHGEEADHNYKLAGFNLCTIKDATHILTQNGIEAQPFPSAVRAYWRQLMRITKPIREPLGIHGATVTGAQGKIRLPANR